MIHHQDDHLTVHIGDCREVLRSLPAESVHCVVTSPPYWGLRDYGVEGALGLEPTPEAFIAAMVEVFREVKRVLRNDGTLWLNMGDSYAHASGGYNPTAPSNKADTYDSIDYSRARGRDGQQYALPPGLKTKDLVGMPWRLAFALQADGWYLRSDIIWSKPNPMPESVTDRPTKAHEYVFLLTKSARYFYDAEAVREPSGEWGPNSHSNGTAGYKGGFSRPERQEGDRGRSPLTMAPGGNQYNPAGRNLRSVWQIATEPYPGAHFATFPQKLVEPCIKAGSSERGVCPECGAPWVREVERESQGAWINDRGDGRVADQDAGLRGQKFYEGWKPPITTTWRPSCGHRTPEHYPERCWMQSHAGMPPHDHAADDPTTAVQGETPVPATVLDPFAGSGTTGLVANRLGRRAILIDLSADYIDQAMLRNQQHPLGLIG
jgi:DNA modification methylase